MLDGVVLDRPVVVVAEPLCLVAAGDALGHENAVYLGETGILVIVGDDLGEQTGQVLAGVRVEGGQVFAGEVLAELDEGEEKPLLAGEVVQDTLPGQAGPLGHGVDGCLLVAPLGEHPQRGDKNLLVSGRRH